MRNLTRRIFAGPMLALVAGAVGLTLVPGAAAQASVKSTAPKTATVKSADGVVNIRSGAWTTSSVVRTVASGSKVSLVCGVVGSQVAGTVRTSTQWDRLTDGSYISHAYVITPTLHICPGASTTPAPIAPVTPSQTQAQFIASAVPGAQQSFRDYGVPASVTLAQAILESGWGKSSLSTVAKNFFGVKCQNGAYGTIASGCYTVTTQECTKAGNCFSTAAAFRTYATMSNSIRDHGNFLKVNSRYKPAFSYSKNPNQFLYEMWKAGYATDPAYVAKVQGVMAQYNLYQYDN